MSNASQGGTGKAYVPTADEIELARRAAQSVEGTIVGVDLIQDPNGKLMVLEVNAVPGWQLLQKVTGHDIADSTTDQQMRTTRKWSLLDIEAKILINNN